MNKLLVILLLLFPFHGAWANELRDFHQRPPKTVTGQEVFDWCKKNLPDINYFHCQSVIYNERKKPNRFDQYDDPPPEPEEKTWLEKQKDKREKKADDKYYCSKKSGKANTTYSAQKIYNACMEKKGY